ncbi:tolloid-like protein 2 [Lutzomyia longipalpis]|uniref:tolloid-like protein 2 n=1 Tax=Lutzomyia longipalpis TaxID=7200 RepID=UPI00248335F5|nr:tolloid-like protein 2 [Lutzomyia longipalpis]
MTFEIWLVLVILSRLSINSVTCHLLRKDKVDVVSMISKTKRAVPPEYASTSSLAVCETFVIGDPEAKTLYSPAYPGNYPNKTDCVVVLEAPVGFLIRLDFRDYFNIEPSEDCKFDFLEIRDGGHGFSSLIGQYCGTDFPPMVTSRERQLWLHFHSDENIEYAGFVAVYEYIPRPTSSIYDDSNCRLEVGGYEGWVNRTDIPTEKMQISMEHNLPLDCMWVIRVWDGWKIQLAFQKFKLEKPNDCDNNFVDVFGEKTDIPSRIKNFCGSIADSVTSNKNILHIRFYAEPPAINSTFSILFTAFREKPAGETCEDDEYDCEDATCISDTLRCNGRVNCRFRWDEDECATDSEGQSEHVVIIIVVFGLILGGMFAAFLISCLRKLIRDHKIIRIRDGGHGFSSLIGQYCGTDFPPMVTSRERQLWLHFHSDENIEYAGFVAVYEYIPRPTSYDVLSPHLAMCILPLYTLLSKDDMGQVGGYEGWVNRTDIPTEKMQISMEHNLPLDCMWVIRVWDGWKIQLAFQKFKLEKPNDCDNNFVDVFGEKTDIPSRIKNFCGSIADSVTSNKNILHIRFYAEPPAINSTFSILFTAFREKPAGETCEDDEYDCEDATCISDTLRCNGRVNCRFRWDEDECATDSEGQSEHVVIIIVVFGLILGGMFAAFLISCLRKLIRDHKIIREHIRQSKESKLDELGRHSTKLPEERQSIKKSRENLSSKLAVSTSSPRGKSVDAISNTGRILDSPDISNRYYREIVPIPSTGSVTHCEMKHPEVLVGWRTSSLQDESHSSDGVGMCDIACQTRESLFQPIFRNKVTQSPIPSSEIRFSTFGYNSPPAMSNIGHELNNPVNQPSAPSVANILEMSDLGCPPPPPPIAHHHHCQHHQMKALEAQKLEEAKRSQRSEEIRKSAPDVIIMTSH